MLDNYLQSVIGQVISAPGGEERQWGNVEVKII
jgi:hypothetical protein